MIRKKIIGILLAGFILLLAGCTAVQKGEIINLEPKEFKKAIEDENVFVIDVHVPEQQHIQGTDEVIAFDKLEENLEKLPKDKNTPIAVYCRSGSMSAQASQTLIDMGYTKVYNLVGGAKNWGEEGYEFM